MMKAFKAVLTVFVSLLLLSLVFNKTMQEMEALKASTAQRTIEE